MCIHFELARPSVRLGSEIDVAGCSGCAAIPRSAPGIAWARKVMRIVHRAVYHGAFFPRIPLFCQNAGARDSIPDVEISGIHRVSSAAPARHRMSRRSIQVHAFFAGSVYRSFKTGVVTVMLMLAHGVMLGQTASKIQNATINHLLERARQGYVEDQVKLAFAFESGSGVAANETESARWFLRAANLGNPLAQNNIAYRYVAGEGVPQDFKEALKWFQRSAVEGYAP